MFEINHMPFRRGSVPLRAAQGHFATSHSHTNYYIDMTAAVCRDNVSGCQFHPEKSGEVGLNILRAFCGA